MLGGSCEHLIGRNPDGLGRHMQMTLLDMLDVCTGNEWAVLEAIAVCKSLEVITEGCHAPGRPTDALTHRSAKRAVLRRACACGRRTTTRPRSVLSAASTVPSLRICSTRPRRVDDGHSTSLRRVRCPLLVAPIVLRAARSTSHKRARSLSRERERELLAAVIHGRGWHAREDRLADHPRRPGGRAYARGRGVGQLQCGARSLETAGTIADHCRRHASTTEKQGMDVRKTRTRDTVVRDESYGTTASR